ncbi:MAG TPA: M28 family metallopeptidase [Candidatus Acidoferrales bacterium]|nr:M28 family metallopeptidase [Candidatus Acidoferrales bacterium]
MKRAFGRLGTGAVLACLAFVLAANLGGAQDTGEISGFARSRVAAERQLEKKFRSVPDAAHAESNLRHLTSEPHMAGTEASHRVAEWLRDQYQSFGFEAEIVSYSAWVPQPREVKLELTKPWRERLASPEQPVDGDSDTHDARSGVAFNAYSPSGDVTAPVVYVNYSTPEDYSELAKLGVDVKGKIVLARYGRNYRGIKAKLAEERGAAGLILYSDPADDGFKAGIAYPNGPWRPMTGIQRGSINYAQLYPGDPLTPGVAATPTAKRLAPADAASLPRIPTLPINAQDAAVILSSLGGQPVPLDWQGGLPFTYHIGPGDGEVHVKLEMEYKLRPLYDVIAKLRGTADDEWVILGNHHDAWVFGAADPGSGTSALLETARALGELARSGWKPRRTIVMCEWDGEELGLIGSTEWVEANKAELQSKAVAYINTDIGVNGPNFTASATPSLKDLVRDVTAEVQDPRTGLPVHDAWSRRAASGDEHQTGRKEIVADTSGKVPLNALGSGSDYSPFLDYAGIPSLDMGFSGDYGVYHSLYDDFNWMKRFGDPTFAYHVALARILGMVALRLDEADILPFDYQAYASEIEHTATDRIRRATRDADEESLEPALDDTARLSTSASNASQALRAISSTAIDPAKAAQINRALVSVEQAFLAPEGLSGRPWFKHTIYAPGSYTGYAAEALPGITEALAGNDSVALRRESDSLRAALLRAAARLDEVARLAGEAARAAPTQH